jgi:hypothetical protein
VAEREDDRYQRLEEHRDDLRKVRTEFLQAPTSTAVRGANPLGRHNLLSEGDSRHTAELVAKHHQVRKKATQKLGVLGPFVNRTIDLSIANKVLLYKQLIRSTMDYACHIRRFAARTHFGKLQVLRIQLSSPCYQCTLVGTSIIGKFTRIWEFHSSPTTSET